MLKKIRALIPLSLLLLALSSLTVSAAAGTARPGHQGNAVALVAIILSIGVIVAFTVMNVMKKKKLNNKS